MSDWTPEQLAGLARLELKAEAYDRKVVELRALPGLTVTARHGEKCGGVVAKLTGQVIDVGFGERARTSDVRRVVPIPLDGQNHWPEEVPLRCRKCEAAFKFSVVAAAALRARDRNQESTHLEASTA